MGMYEIPQEMMYIDHLIDMSEGEVTPEIQEKFDAVMAKVKENVDPLVKWIRNLDAREDRDKDEGKFFTNRGKFAGNKKEKLKKTIIDALIAIGVEKMYGNMFVVTVRDASRPKITWEGEGEPPKKYTRTTIETSIDGDKLYELWKLDKLPPGFKAEKSKWLHIG